jgi:hypothetical protein
VHPDRFDEELEGAAESIRSARDDILITYTKAYPGATAVTVCQEVDRMLEPYKASVIKEHQILQAKSSDNLEVSQ